MLHIFEPAVWQTLAIELLKVGAGATVLVLGVVGITYLIATKRNKTNK